MFSDADGTGSLRDSGDTTTVTEVDHEEGLVTCADTLNTKITGIATTDYVFQDGDYNACLAGLEDWLPVDDRATKLGALEEKDALKRRIDEAAKFVPLDRLCLSPQCGFSSTHHGNALSQDDQWRKLERVLEVAHEVWG